VFQPPLLYEDVMTTTSIPQTPSSSAPHPDMPPRSDPGAAPQTGRGPKGRFAKGNPGGPGNPFARQVAAFRQEFMAAVTGEDIAVIVRALIEKAKAGDVAAARLVLQYTLGKPAATVDPDRLDEMEWEQWQRENIGTDSDKVWMGMNAASANAIARAVVPVMQKEHFAEIKQQMDERDADDCEDDDDDEHDERQDEGEAHCAGRRREQPEAAPAPARKEGSVKTPVSVDPSATASPIVGQEADEGGQSAPADGPLVSAERLLRLLSATVTKREETARRAANDFMD
jgi:hypothetical protein